MADRPTDTEPRGESRPGVGPADAGLGGTGRPEMDVSTRPFRLGRDVLTVDSPTDFPPTRGAGRMGDGSEDEFAGDGLSDDDFEAGPSLRLFDADDAPRRPAWRQRLVDAERGFSHSFRSESTLTAYFCAAGAGLLMAGVLRVTAIEGAVLLVAFTQAVFVELGRIAVREMTTREAKAHRVMATASVMAAVTGLAVAALTLGRRLLEAWG